MSTVVKKAVCLQNGQRDADKLLGVLLPWFAACSGFVQCWMQMTPADVGRAVKACAQEEMQLCPDKACCKVRRSRGYHSLV
eukprot:3956418-Amphidinium_carterae.1